MQRLRSRNGKVILILIGVTLFVLLGAAAPSLASGLSLTATPPPPVPQIAPTLSAAARGSTRFGLQHPAMDFSYLQAVMPAGVSAAALPASLNWHSTNNPLGRDVVSPVQNQSQLGTCYAFAAVGQMESRLMMDNAFTAHLSEQNAANCPLQKRGGGKACEGGWEAYVVNWFTQKGTVLASDDPYNSASPACGACNETGPFQQTALGMDMVTGDTNPDTNVLKALLQKYGPLWVTVKADNPGATGQTFDAYGPSSPPIYMPLNPSDGTDHAVLLVGWDDTTAHAGGTGVWIAKNSWDTGWGKNGYFEIAYGSGNFGRDASAVTEWQPASETKDLLLYDKYGQTSSSGYGDTTAWGLNKFTTTQAGCADRVEFWTTDKTSNVEVYLYDTFDGQQLGTQLAHKTAGAFEAGYHSVKLDTPVTVGSGQSLVAVAKFVNVNSTWPVPLGQDVSTNSYMSHNGQSWSTQANAVGIRIRTSDASHCSSSTNPATAVPTALPTATVPPTPYVTATPAVSPVNSICQPSAARVVSTPRPTAVAPGAAAANDAALVAARLAASNRAAARQAAALPRPGSNPAHAGVSHFKRPPAAELNLLLTPTPLPLGLSTPAAPTPQAKGRVLLPDDAAAVGAAVWAYPVAADGSRTYGNYLPVETNSAGDFALYLTPGDYSLDIVPADRSVALMIENVPLAITSTATVDMGTLQFWPTVKRITGEVLLGTQPVTNALVTAYDSYSDVSITGRTDSAGQFDVGVPDGWWEVSVEPIPNTDVNWAYTGYPEYAQFIDGPTQPETQTVSFTVDPVEGYLSGQVLAPGGVPLTMTSGINYSAGVGMWNPTTGYATSEYLDQTGHFKLPMLLGSYEPWVWLDDVVYPLYAAPVMDNLDFTATTTLAPIQLELKSAVVTGTVRNSAGQGVSGVEVDFWQDSGRWADVVTDENGRYLAPLVPGTWTVAPYVDDAMPYLYTQNPVELSVNAGETKPANFVLENAASMVQGQLVAASGVLTNVEGWAYAHRANDPEPFIGVPLVGGQFAMKVPTGEVWFGLDLAPDSHYTLMREISITQAAAVEAAAGLPATARLALAANRPYEQRLMVAPGAQDLAPRPITLTLAANDAVIAGYLKTQAGQVITGVTGQVYAMPAEGATGSQWADLNPDDGSYRLSVAGGQWLVNYNLNTDRYLQNADADLAVTAHANGTVTQDLTARSLDGVIQGVVKDHAGQALSNVFVWVKGRNVNYETFVQTELNGSYVAYVPLGTYEVSTALPDCADNATTCDQNAALQVAVAQPRPAGRLTAAAITTDLLVRDASAFLYGQVLGLDGQPLANAQVGGASGDAQTFQTTTDANGCFAAQVTGNDTTWSINAAYEDANGDAFSDSLDILVVAGRLQSAKNALQLNYAGRLPAAESHTFRVSEGWSGTLPDGTTVQIPANAIPTSEDEVVLSIRPTVYMPPSVLYEAVRDAYDLHIYEKISGREINGDFNSYIQLGLRYDPAQLNQTEVSHLQPSDVIAGGWQPSDNFTVNANTDEVTVMSRHLSTWALMVAKPSIDHRVFLPFTQR